MDYEFYELLGEKARDIITDLLASWYNFTVAQSLTRWKRVCWAITASYYSMMLATRGLVTLLVFESIDKEEYVDLRDFIQYHSKLIRLLKKKGHNNNVTNWWNKADFSPFKEMLERYGYLTDAKDIAKTGTEMTSNVGKLLENCKAFRENSSYDTYIIMAQHWRRVTTGDAIFKNFRDDIRALSDKILEQDQKYLIFISDALATFLNVKKSHPELNVIIPIQVKLYLSLVNELYELLDHEGLLTLYKYKLDPITENFVSEYRDHRSNNRFSECFNTLSAQERSENIQSFLRGFGIPDRKKEGFDRYLSNLRNLENAISEFKFVIT